MAKITCPICAKGQLVEQNDSYETKYLDRDGLERSLILADVKRQQCDRCGEDILDDAATRRIEDARRAAMGLLSAVQIRELRSRFGKTQVQMSKLLGVGEKTYCRWESGSFIQSVAFDNYLRLICDVPEASALLIRLEHGGNLQAPDTGHHDDAEFAFLGDIDEVSESAGKFTQLMYAGTLHIPAEYLT